MTINYKILLSQSDISQSKVPEKLTDDLNCIQMRKGSSFWNIKDDLQPIYTNFNLLSYFSSSCDISILDRCIYEDPGSKYLSVELFTFKKSSKTFLMMLKNKDELNLKCLPKLTSPAIILYEVRQIKGNLQSHNFQGKGETDFEKAQKMGQISVQFSTEVVKLERQVLHYRQKKLVRQKQREIIWINVIDKDGWINKNFTKIQSHEERPRLLVSMKSKTNQVQYFYRQSTAQRFRRFNEDHISLALQGGGCKGVQYIGAYQAILQNNNINKTKIPIKSIIGSSAGSIIGLAICCELDPVEIIQICSKILSKVTGDQKYKKIPEKDSGMKKYFESTMQALRGLNILDNSILQILERILPDPQFQKILLQIIRLATNEEIYKLFHDVEGNLNLQGLINAELMTGDVIAQIGATCIQKLFLRSLSKGDKKFINKYGYLFKIQNQALRNQKILKTASSLTMRQLYYLTEIQFTCTTVDINNHILRFLNHKTTPDLPVCKAVQMSGSFPVAFQAQKWQKSWGKYYIHYHSIRKEIDLTGCTLTDGGTLANFPIKYLDNEDMRPMYFSHVKTKSTLMYGFGLKTYIKLNQQQKEQQIQLQNKIKELGQLVLNKVGKCMPLCAWIKSKLGCYKPIQKTIDNVQTHFNKIKQIPLFDFGWKLLQTFSYSRDNLIEQCYTHRTFQTKISTSYRRQLQNKPDHQQYAFKIKELLMQMQKILPSNSGEFNEKYLLQVFEKNIRYLLSSCRDKIFQVQKLYQVVDILLYNMNSFLKGLFQNLGQKQKTSVLYMLKKIIRKKFNYGTENQNVVSLMIEQISNIKRQKPLKLCGIEEDTNYLTKALQILDQFYCQIKNNHLQKLKETFKQLNKRESLKISQIKDSLKKSSHIRQNYQLACEESYYKNQIICLSKIFHLTITIKIEDIKKMIHLFKKSEIPQLFVYFQSYSSKYNLQSYITKEIMGYKKRERVDSQKDPIKFQGLHIVFQSIFLSELYFHEYYMILTETLLEYNSKMKEKVKDFQQVKVSTITSTSYHSIAMFLHASDLPQHRISEQILKIRELIKIDIGKLIEDFEKGNWAKITPLLLKQAQSQAIKNKKDIFSCIQEGLEEVNQNQEEKVERIKSAIQKNLLKMEQENQIVSEAIESSLNHIVSLLSEIDYKILKQKDIDEIIKEKLMFSRHPKINSQSFQKYAKHLKQLCNFFFQKYKDIFEYVIYHYPLRADQICKLLKPDQRKQIWKIVLLCEIVSGKNIKNYIKKILKDSKLKPNTTLKQFYDYSSQKIQLNFSVIEEDVVYILNHITRPNMPMWAAVLAATSTPQFFVPVLDRPEWRVKQQKDFDKRKVKSFFEKNKKPYRFITSSELITRMPLDLLTNNKYKSQITDKNNEIFIVFNFEPENIRLERLKLKKDFVVTPLGLGQLIDKFVSFRSIISQKLCRRQKNKVQKQELEKSQEEINKSSAQLFSKIPFMERKIKLLKLYIENHDNLMCQLYKREIILLPVRFDTLDFHKMNKRLPNGQQVLSDICEDAIMQAKYIILQKMQNRYFYEEEVKNNKVNGDQKFNIGKSYKYQVNKVIKNSKTSGKYLESKNQFGSKRKFYFRVQSFQENNVQSQNKLTDQSYAYLSERVIFRKQNKLKLRFLSFLNPSRQIFQKFNIYYSTKHLPYSYRKVQSESLVLNQSHPQIYLKIQFPSSDLMTVNTSYFLLDFLEIFQLFDSQKISSKGKQIKKFDTFGFVYPLIFDYLYQGSSGVGVNPVGDANQDYMNKNNSYVKKPKVHIKSQIKNTKNQQFICHNCISYLQPVKNFNAKAAFTCIQCNQNYDINNYSLHYDNKRGNLSCLQGHILKRKQFNFKNFDSMTLNQYVCDKCGNGTFKQFWKDEECNLCLCDKCTRESYCLQKQIDLVDQL